MANHNLSNLVAQPSQLAELAGLSLSIQSIATIPLTEKLVSQAFKVKQEFYGNLISYSPKVFIPLTFLCRDVCHYCTFAKTPKKITSAYLSNEKILEICKVGSAQGCYEALFTLGEKPELRYKTARDFLTQQNLSSTVQYLHQQAKQVFDETGFIPHINAGNLSIEELIQFKQISGSVGLMVESSSDRLTQKGMPHYGSPDKKPSARIETLINAGIAKIPFTTGVLIGIGETKEELVKTLLEIVKVHKSYNHIQEVIIQNFVPKPQTLMFDHPPASTEYLIWAIAIARLILPIDISIQVPPNLNKEILSKLILSGINDFGGVSPVTIDHVNPESSWPNIKRLEELCNRFDMHLVSRLTIYPKYLSEEFNSYLSKSVRSKAIKLVDASGFLREDDWRAGESQLVPSFYSTPKRLTNIKIALDNLDKNKSIKNISALFQARGSEVKFLGEAALEIKQTLYGNKLTFVNNRNINYTNICKYSCNFCAFSKGRGHDDLRGKPYDISFEEIQRRVLEAERRGATEVCLQGGIHPKYTGETYLKILDSIREVSPTIHIHAFSPLEIKQGSRTLNMSIQDYLNLLKKRGLNSIPGTAAEILHDPVRNIICPDKLTSAEWIEVITSAHSLGIPTTSTIMFGHVETYHDIAIHLLKILNIQEQYQGFTEFVPLPFVSQEAPIFRRGSARPGPSFRETFLMHSIARLLFKEKLPNIQGSWVKAGIEGLMELTKSGINDIGGILMNESITRAAGSVHGQELDIRLITNRLMDKGIELEQRNTLYAKLSNSIDALVFKLAIPLQDISSQSERVSK
ncbi:MAG: 5-amino-6-(D-ribitylamino)uracil--L-tyrosine 4-hydroxyphenyl transferase CofH [Gammaproteobacteria bacterium]